jgi:hypothetical protein
MRRAFTLGDFLNTRLAQDGDELEYGRTNVPANMGGECDPVYGFWEHDRKTPVFVPDGSTVDFEGMGECVEIVKESCVKCGTTLRIYERRKEAHDV